MELALFFQKGLDFDIIFVEPVLVVSGGRAEHLEGCSTCVSKHVSERFPRFSSFIFLCDILKGALAVILTLSAFAKGVSSGHADPT